MVLIMVQSGKLVECMIRRHLLITEKTRNMGARPTYECTETGDYEMLAY